MGMEQFMDDVYMLFFYDTRNLETKINAQNLKEEFNKKCYYPQWNLKAVEGKTFLSSECTWYLGKIHIKWANKNKLDIKLGKVQKIFRFIHAKSFTAESIKRNTVYSQMLRVARNSDNNNLKNDLEDLS